MEVDMSFLNHRSASLVLVAALPSAVVACRATFRAGPDAPFIGGSTLELEIDGNTCGVPETPGNPPAGTCVELTFLDASGNVIGSAQTTVGGGSVSAPPGAEDVRVNGCDPEPEPEPDIDTSDKPAKKKKKPKSSGAANLVAGAPQPYGYHVIPFDVEDGIGRYAAYDVLAASRAEADEISTDFVQGMLSEALPPQVVPKAIVRTQVTSGGDVLVSMYTDEAPQSLSLRWNGGAPIGLGGATVVAFGDWHVTSVSIPAADVDYSPLGSNNRLEYLIALPGREVGTTLDLTVEP
jgi:hypothetical protein